jgi:NAD+ kinase
MLAVAVLRGGEEVNSQFALNDLVVTKGPLARLMRLEARVDGQPLADFAADGVIIATPGGSTAYSLSAGGPLVAPEVRAMLLTPICAHTLSMRPLVVPAHARLEVSVGRIEREQQVVATVDGQVAYPLEAKDVVSITQAPFPARLVTLGGPGFYEKLRTKLGWGG